MQHKLHLYLPNQRVYRGPFPKERDTLHPKRLITGAQLRCTASKDTLYFV